MNKKTTRIATALLLGLLCAAPAFAKVKSRVITVGQDFIVGATTVKAGTYRFSFDDATNTLSVVDRKTKETLAKAEAHAEARKEGKLTNNIELVDSGSSKALASVAFDGEKESYTIAAASTAAR